MGVIASIQILNEYADSHIRLWFIFYRRLLFMKDIHPKYYPEAKIKCSCGKIFTVGATKPEINVEICGACHPFYTGEEKMIDTAGRVERFKTRKAKIKPKVKKAVRKKK